jgi:hypothetical protein
MGIPSSLFFSFLHRRLSRAMPTATDDFPLGLPLYLLFFQCPAGWPRLYPLVVATATVHASYCHLWRLWLWFRQHAQHGIARRTSASILCHSVRFLSEDSVGRSVPAVPPPPSTAADLRLTRDGPSDRGLGRVLGYGPSAWTKAIRERDGLWDAKRG